MNAKTHKNFTGSYRYHYNSMEMDAEVSGSGNSYTTEFRQYDPRLGRWKSLDPLMAQFPWMSPYVAFDNNPVYFIDPYGLSASNGDDPVTVIGTKDKPGRRWKDENGKRHEWEEGDIYIDKDGNEHKYLGKYRDRNFEDSWIITKGKIQEIPEVSVVVNRDRRTSGDKKIIFDGVLSDDGYKFSVKKVVNLSETANDIREKVKDPRISGSDGLGSFIFALANCASSGGDLGDIPPMDLIPIPGADMIGEHLNNKWDEEMLEVYMRVASSNWDEMKKFADKYNTKNSTVVVFVYAAMDVHMGTPEMLGDKVPTTRVFNSAEEAKKELGFVPAIVYFKFITPSSNNLRVFPNNKVKFH